MKNLLSVIFLLFTLISCNTLTPNKEVRPKDISSVIPTDKNVTKGILSNGMTYYIRKNSKPEQKVELRLVVKAGSILENEKQLGLAHFMEHMNFNGSKNFNKNELVDYLQSIGVKFGAHLNAYTSFDETVYILPIPSDNEEKLEKGFQILEDWAFNASLTDEEIEKERGVVLEEYRLGLGAGKRMLNKYLPKLMHNSRYAERLPIGTKKVLENFTHQELRNFYKDWYRPDLMAVVAVGDIDPKVLENKVKTHFEKYKRVKNAKKRTEFNTPNHKQTLISVNTDSEATRSSIQLYYKDQNNNTPTITVNNYQEDITNHLFSKMFNNRLDDLRNSEIPPFIYAGTSYTKLWDKSKNAYQAYALTSETGQLDALKTITKENERVLRYGFLESELKRAKKSLLSNMEKAFNEKDKTESKRHASEYIQNFLNKEPIPGIEWEYTTLKNIINNIKLSDCNALVSKYIHKDNRVVILTGPKKKEIPSIKEEEITQILDNVGSLDIKPYAENLSDEGLMKNIKPIKGKIVDLKKDTVFNITKLTLSNGAKVSYKKTDFKNNQILFSAFSYGGTSLYSNEEYKKTNIANSALTEAGVNGYSKNDLKKLLSDKQARVTPILKGLSEGFKGNASPKDLETLFQLTYLYFNKLNYSTSAYNSYKSKIQAYLKNISSNPTTYYSIELNKFLNKNNPRYVGFPTEELIANTDYKLAYDKYQERFANAGDFNFYFVGNFDEHILKEYCTTYLASLPNINRTENYKNATTEPLTGILEKNIKKGTEPKSMVKIIYAGLAKNYEKKDAYYLKSLGEVLTIKLVEQLREEESGVYGVKAKGNLSKLPVKRYNYTISFPCGPENIDKLIKKALKELDKIKENGVSEKDLNKIKETQRLEHKEALKRNGYWLNAIKNADFNNSNIDKYISKEEKIKSLTSENLKKIANKYLTKNRIISTLNPEK